jgi:hypothetical protein
MENGRIDLVYISMAISVCPLVIFVLSAINQKVAPVPSVFTEIISSLNNYPINDLSYDYFCNEKYLGNLYVFPGTQFGCSCIHPRETDSYSEYNEVGKDKLNYGNCEGSMQITNGCFEIKGINGHNMQSWGKGKFCSKKYKISEFELNGYVSYLKQSVLKNEQCESGYKKCGKLDDFGNYLCIKESEDCPINDIQVTNSRDEELEKLGYSHIIINDEKYLYYTNTSDKPVITKLKAAEEGILCMDRTNLYTNFPQYLLDYNFDNYGCRYIDGKNYEKIFEILDKRTKELLYEDSGFNASEKFPSYNYGFPFSSLKANMVLYPHRYIGFDKKCFSENGLFSISDNTFTNDKINDINELIKDIKFINNFTKWFSVVSIFFELLACGICNIIKDNFQIRIWIWTLINSLFYVSMAVPLYLNLPKIQKLFIFPSCGNDLINLRINSFNSCQRTLKVTTVISVVFLNLQIVFNLFIIIIRYIIDKREKSERIYNQPLVLKNYSSEDNIVNAPSREEIKKNDKINC